MWRVCATPASRAAYRLARPFPLALPDSPSPSAPAFPPNSKFPTYMSPQMVEAAMAHTPQSPLSPSKLTP